jgi:MFS family permease
MALVMLPWIAKPAYGLLSDAVPIFGYRRKSYIIIGHAIALVGLACLAVAHASYMVLAGLMLLALAMAIATALLLGLAAERGQQDGNAARYVSAQSFYYYMGNIGAVMLGGALCQTHSPQMAIHDAALWAMVPVAILMIASFAMIDEPKSHRSVALAKDAFVSIISAIKQPPLWKVLGLAFLWNFTPSFGVPLYFHQSKNLLFEQSLIGQLAAWNALGMMIGAVIYRERISRLELRTKATTTIALWSLSIASYAFLSTPQSAYPIELFRGCANTIELLCLYELATASCDSRNAVSVMALLLASRNFANQVGNVIGGNLFTSLHHEYLPLVIIGSFAPLVSLLLMPRSARVQNDDFRNCEDPGERDCVSPSHIGS